MLEARKLKSPLGASQDVSLSYWFLYLLKSLSIITNQVQLKTSLAQLGDPLKVTMTSKPAFYSEGYSMSHLVNILTTPSAILH